MTSQVEFGLYRAILISNLAESNEAENRLMRFFFDKPNVKDAFT